MTLDEAINVLEWGRPHDTDPEEEIKRFNIARGMAVKALTTMRDMKNAEDINRVVEILQDYMSKVD